MKLQKIAHPPPPGPRAQIGFSLRVNEEVGRVWYDLATASGHKSVNRWLIALANREVERHQHEEAP